MTNPSSAVERRVSIDQDRIDRYAELSGDRNPLHLDPQFARERGFSGTIAHGLLTLGIVSAVLEDEWGDAWARGGALDIRFSAPVPAGSEVVVRATPAADDDAERRRYELEAVVGERVVIRGTVSVSR